MMFVHNTNESAIKSFDQMGGIPSPSLAVQPADVPLKGFGQIQLIAKPKNFDPAVDPRNAVYSADAYTPRAPKKIRLAKDDAVDKIKKDYKDFIKEGRAGGLQKLAIENLEKLKKNRGATILEDSSDSFDSFFTNTTLAKRKFLKDQNLNSKNFIDDVGFAKPRFPERKYRDWVAKEKDKYLSQEGVFTYFDDFEQTTVTKPYTLENATENMIKETQRGGEGGFGGYGPNRLRALMTKKLTDLEDIKSQRFKIQDNPGYSNFDQGIEDVLITESKLADDGDAIYNIAMEEQDELIKQIALNIEDGYSLEDAVGNAFYFYDVKPTQRLVDNTIDVFKKNAERNVEYLEAKPMRAVGFEEFAGAIVPPKTSKEVIDILENRGLKVIKNDPETDFMKTKARQKFKDQMFSIAPIAGAGGITALSLSDNVDEDDKGIGSL